MSEQVTREIDRRELEDEPRPIRSVRVERQGQPPLVLPLYADVEYTFGRSGDSSVVFSDDAVSRQHGRLWCDAQMRWVYRDLASSNGTFRTPRGRPDALLQVTGSGPVTLAAGDVLTLGTERSRLVLLDTQASPQTRSTARDALPSAASRALEERVQVAAHHQLPVVLFGASGTGKTFTARRIHELSGCRGTFILLNCGRLPRAPAELQSELLGHVRGAYTGAQTHRTGKLFAADQGTLFLDEVESLSREAQDFLIDVLEGTGVFAPLGAPAEERPPPPRFRLISAAKTPLGRSSLRPDLVQRLLGDAITLPSLDERREDIAPLVARFLAEQRDERGIDAELTPEALAILRDRRWPGQVRELRRVVETTAGVLAASRRARGLDTERLVVGLEALQAHLDGQASVMGSEPEPATSQHQAFVPRDEVAPDAGAPRPHRPRPADLTRAQVQAVLDAHGGNKTHAAKALGIALNTLKAKLKQ